MGQWECVLWDTATAQGAKVPAAQSEDPSSILRAYKAEKENKLVQLFSELTYKCHGTHSIKKKKCNLKLILKRGG